MSPRRAVARGDSDDPELFCWGGARSRVPAGARAVLTDLRWPLSLSHGGRYIAFDASASEAQILAAHAYPLERGDCGLPASFVDGAFVPPRAGARVAWAETPLGTASVIAAARAARGLALVPGADQPTSDSSRKTISCRFERWMYHCRAKDIHPYLSPAREVAEFAFLLTFEKAARYGGRCRDPAKAAEQYVSAIHSTLELAFGFGCRGLADVGIALAAARRKVKQEPRPVPPAADISLVPLHVATWGGNADMELRRLALKAQVLLCIDLAGRPSTIRGIQLVGAHTRLIGADGRAVDFAACLQRFGPHPPAPPATRANPSPPRPRHPLQELVVALEFEVRNPKDVRAREYSETIRVGRAPRTVDCSVETFVDLLVRQGLPAVASRCDRAGSGKDVARYGRSPFAVDGRDPERSATSRAIAAVCVDAGLVSAAAVPTLGPGKVLRKYASSALRLLQPAPTWALDAALDRRHLHGRAVWSAAYRCAPYAPLLRAWAALQPAQREAMSVEALLRWRLPPARSA